MFGWTEFQSIRHSQRRPLAFFLSFLCSIRSIFYTGRRARTAFTHVYTCTRTTKIDRSSEAPWCMFHVHSFINKFSHYRSSGDDFSSLCVYFFVFVVVSVAFFHQKSSNRSVRLMVNHLRREPKTIWTSHTPYGILSSRYGFWFDAIAATVTVAHRRCLLSMLGDRTRKKRKLDMRRCEIVDCIVRSMIAKYFFGSSISWHGQR